MVESVTLYTQRIFAPSSSKYSGLFKNIEVLRRNNVLYMYTLPAESPVRACFECLASLTLHPGSISLSQKIILGVSFLCCHNFSEENNINMQESFQFTTERNLRRFFF